MIAGGTGTGIGTGQVLVCGILFLSCYQARNKNHSGRINRRERGGGSEHQDLKLRLKAWPRCPVRHVSQCCAEHPWCIICKHPTSLGEPLDHWATTNSGGSGDQSTLLMPFSRFIIIDRGGWCLELGGLSSLRKNHGVMEEFRQSNLATNIKSLVQAIVRHGTWQPHRQRLFPFLGANVVTMSIEWIPSSDLSYKATQSI